LANQIDVASVCRNEASSGNSDDSEQSSSIVHGTGSKSRQHEFGLKFSPESLQQLANRFSVADQNNWSADVGLELRVGTDADVLEKGSSQVVRSESSPVRF